MLRRTWSPRFAVVLGYLAVALIFTWPLPVHLSTHFTGDPGGDTGVYVWNQWVFQQEALIERANPFTTGKILALTQRVNLSQHNYTAFLNLLALPLMPLLGVVATFNVVYLLTTVITALATYLLVRRVTAASRAEAFLAGVLFAWSPVLVARSSAHFSLVAAAPLPAFLLCLLRATRTLRARDGALAGLCGAWAAFCDVYYAVYCLLIATAYFGAHVVFTRREVAARPRRWIGLLDVLILCVTGLVVGLLLGRSGQIELFGVRLSVRGLYTPMLMLTILLLVRVWLWSGRRVTTTWVWSPRLARAVAVGLVACAAPLAPVLYGLGEQIVAGRLVSPATPWRSSPRGIDLLAWFSPNPSHPLSKLLWADPQRSAPVPFAEYTASLSLVALAVVGFAGWRANYRPRAGWMLLTIGFGLLALGPFVYVAGLNTHVPGPWALLRYVPLLGAARTPTRFSVVVALGLAVLFAGGLAAIRLRYPHVHRRVFAGVAAALLFELLPAPRILYSAEIPSVYRVIAADPRPVRVLELPFGVRDGVSSAGNFSARYQYFQTAHGKALLGGYLSRVPRHRLERMRADYPIVDTLITLSEGGQPTVEQRQRFAARRPGFVDRVNLGWVVIDHSLATPELVAFAHEAFALQEVARDPPRVLYRPR